MSCRALKNGVMLLSLLRDPLCGGGLWGGGFPEEKEAS